MISKRWQIARKWPSRLRPSTRKLWPTEDRAKAEASVAAKSLEDARSPYYFALQPVVGFSADWAGPEAAETIQKGNYMRWIPNMIQVPRRMVDWSLFVRTLYARVQGPLS